MAKQTYEVKKTIKIVGVLDEREDGTLFVRVEDPKDIVREFDLKDIMKEMIGTLVTFSNEETL